MILGYKQRFPWGKKTDFKAKILSGAKMHSFRKDPKNRWLVGMKIQQAIYRFRMQYHCFAEMECKCIQTIKIEKADDSIDKNCFIFREVIRGNEYIMGFKIIVDNKVLDRKAIAELAHNDGFDFTDDFFRIFRNGFDGYIIHWTDLKY
jgi:hypothetical protein